MNATADPVEPREGVGRLVRQVWVEWAREQPDAKPSWLTPWDELDDGQREVDMRIGLALFAAGRVAAPRMDWERHARGYAGECHEAEQILAAALGYSTYGSDGPGTEGDHATGDHTVVTLAMEAAAEIGRLRRDAAVPGVVGSSGGDAGELGPIEGGVS